jgi:hypothetical protein
MRLHVTGVRLIAFLAIALIVGAGLCVFDPPGDRCGVIDLCLLFVLPVSLVILSVVLRPMERLAPASAGLCLFTPRDPLAPPPRH